MITEKDLLEAIAECEGQRNPNANTCIKLAAFYTIKRELYGDTSEPPTVAKSATVDIPGYAYDPPHANEPEPIYYDSGTDFSQAINGKYADNLWPIFDELLTVLQATSPRLFDGVMRKIAQA